MEIKNKYALRFTLELIPIEAYDDLKRICKTYSESIEEIFQEEIVPTIKDRLTEEEIELERKAFYLDVREQISLRNELSTMGFTETTESEDFIELECKGDSFDDLVFKASTMIDMFKLSKGELDSLYIADLDTDTIIWRETDLHP